MDDFLVLFDKCLILEKYGSNEEAKLKNITTLSSLISSNLYQKIKNKYSELCTVKNFLINKNILKNKDLDDRGDLLILNTRNISKRGSEDYNPPYGWIGIGLNVSGKYNENKDDENGKWLLENKESEWANVYLESEQKKKNRNINKLDDIKNYFSNIFSIEKILLDNFGGFLFAFFDSSLLLIYLFIINFYFYLFI